MIDTHTHIYFREAFPDGGEEAVRRALDSGVETMVFPNVSLESAEELLSLHHKAPEGATAVAAGLHPEEIDRDWRAKMQAVFDRFADEKPVAVGEVGIDLYHDKTWKIEQMDAFGEQLEIARARRLPVIIHCREALDETLEVIRILGPDRPGLLFHSFTGGPDEVRRITDEVPGALFGINGVVTFKNAPALRDSVREMDIKRIVTETDSPYLAPVPKRGRTNESSYLRYVLDKIAETKGMAPEEVERVTSETAQKFFGI